LVLDNFLDTCDSFPVIFVAESERFHRFQQTSQVARPAIGSAVKIKSKGQQAAEGFELADSLDGSLSRSPVREKDAGKG